MGFKNLNHTNMRFLIVAALCAIASAAPEGRRLRPEEHWRPARGRDLSKYKPRAAMVDANGDDLMEKINRVAAEMRASASPSNKKDLGQPKAACGIEGPAIKEGRIVGGVEATEHAWPWQVALFIDDAWFCGGSIISENYVLTAAHCADGDSYFDVTAGAHNVRESSEPNRVEITSFNGWTHPDWDPNTLSNDIALIELPSPITFDDYIKPSCQPSSGDTADVAELVTATGWGKPSDNAGGISPVLRMVEDLPIISNAECNAIYGIVGDGVVCIDTTGGTGTCNGDSGGPLNMKFDVVDK